MSGIVGSRFNIRGSGLVGSLGTDGQVFTSSGAGKSAVFEAAAAGGKILQVSQKWYAASAGVGATTTFLYVYPMERGLSALASTSSKVYIIADGGRMGVAYGDAKYKFYGRTGSNAFASIHQFGMDTITGNHSSFGTKHAPLSFSFLWAPSTTDTVDVQLWAKGSAGAEINAADCQVFMTIMEIAG